MNGKTKSFFLALAAVAAMSMMAAAAAQGSELHIESGQKQAAVITGEQTTQHVYQLTTQTGPKSTCTQAHFEGTVQGGPTQITAQEITITPRYTGCQSFGQAATIDMNGCKYTFTNKLGQTTTALTATVDITGCTTIAGQQNHKPIEITTAACTITMPQQHNLSKLTFQNVAGAVPKHINVKLAISGITYELHGPLCGHAVTVLTHDATIHGDITFKAFEDVSTALVTHNGHQYLKAATGSQFGLVAT